MAKNMDGSTENYKFIIDDRPIEMLTPKERQERFDRQIGPDIDRLSDEDIKPMRKAYLLDEDEDINNCEGS